MANHELILKDLPVVLRLGKELHLAIRDQEQNRSFAEIQLIRISRAHWDYYGGLVNLLLQMQQIKGTDGKTFSCIVQRQQK